MTAPFHAGALARLHSLDGPPGGFGVILAMPPVEPSLRAVTTPGSLTAFVDHERGATWPDRTGQQVVRAALEQGGVALLAFSDLRDAMACTLRLRCEGVG